LAGIAEAGRVFLGRNLHAVVPGRVYRCAQLSGPGLEQVVHAYGVRGVVNLRGCCDPAPEYLEECRATHRLGIAQYDIELSAGRLPSVHEMRRFVEVLDRADYPLLLHCKRGADRTGLASAVTVLLQTDSSLAEARRQLGLRYGHLALGRPAYLDQFLELYTAWLGQQERDHAPALFRRWLWNDYCPGPCRCTLEPLAFPAWIPCGEPTALRVRAHNTGIQTWQLRPGTNAGIHLGFVLRDPHENCIAYDRSGLFNAEVAPGHSIDLTLALPALHEPGRYRLFVDMKDEQQCWFYQTGSEPLEWELEVR
jgi:hypothetical protein